MVLTAVSATPTIMDIMFASMAAEAIQKATLHPIDTLKARLQYEHGGGVGTATAARHAHHTRPLPSHARPPTACKRQAPPPPPPPPPPSHHEPLRAPH